MAVAEERIASRLECVDVDDLFQGAWNAGQGAAELLIDIQADERHFKEIARRIRARLG